MNDVIHPLAMESRAFILRSLRPETPLFAWLDRLDDVLAAAPDHFGDRHVVLDLTAVSLHGPGARALWQELQAREFRVIGLSGIDAGDLGAEAMRLPPIIAVGDVVASSADRAVAPLPTPAVPLPTPVVPLIITRNIRSGQEVVHTQADVTIVGSVASGAEVVAGGSIHIYGVLQGRAFAGPDGSIFCQRLEAELLRIGDVFISADDMPAGLRGRAVHVWRDGDAIRCAAL